MIFDRKG